MDGFALFIFGSILLIVVIFLLIGKYYPGSGADQLDWKPTRSYEDEIRLELEDVDQMIEAQNERRRARGRPEITEEQVRADVEREERRRKEEAERYRAGDEQQLDQEDFEQLVEMHNERRRRRGEPEVTLEEFKAGVEAERGGASGQDAGERS